MGAHATQSLVLVDGSSYIYRAFHALPSFNNSKGFPTGAIYGVVNMLRKLLTDYKPEHIAVVFDAPGKTFRDEIYDQYKANRSEMPSDLVRQIKPIHSIINALGLPILMLEGVEADDVIGTLAKQASREGKNVLISTSDKDLAQLVDEHITLVNTMTGSILNKNTVIEKFGIPSELIVDYLALVGDTVDNIPGVPMVGPKTASKWLVEYGSLEKIMSSANLIKGKVGENLRNCLDKLPLSRQLATIKLDVSLDINYINLNRKIPETKNLIELYREYEFKTWLAELLEKDEDKQNKNTSGYEIVYSESILDEWIKKLIQAKIFSLNIYTNIPNYMDARIVGISFSIDQNKAIYIPLSHDYNNAHAQLDTSIVLNKLKPLFENSTLQKICHNYKYFYEILTSYGIHLNGVLSDTMLESYILDSSSNSHDINSLALKYLGVRTIHLEDIAGKGAKQLPFNHISIEQAAAFSTELSDIVFQLHQKLHQKIKTESGLKKVLEEIELPLSPVLARVERNGVLIDAEKLHIQTHELETKLIDLEEKTFSIAGCSFNLGSPKQLQEILFTKLKLPILQKTPTGQPSTADPVLQELALEFELPKLIIEYRSLSKLITTYTKRLPEQVNETTGRVHTSYNQTGAATGRLSSSEPNLQNIPIRTAEGRRIRQAFVPRPGCKLVSADYSQIELRIMSHISEDPALLNAFEKNLDIHQATAAEVLGIPLEKVTNEQRRSAKAVNFGLIYGMSSFGLAKQLGIDRGQAQEYIDRYFTRYPLVKRYMETTRAKAHTVGFVETLSGRRSYLPDINSSQMMRQKAAERAAINAPLQGTAADIIKQAMIAIDYWLMHEKIDARMIMQVHDELVFEVNESIITTFIDQIRSKMMNAATLKVPLIVSIGVGDNWDAASSH